MARRKRSNFIKDVLDGYNSTKGIFGDIASSGAYEEGAAVTGPEDAETVQAYKDTSAGLGDTNNEQWSHLTPEQRAAASAAYQDAATAGAQYHVGRGNGSLGQAYVSAPTDEQKHLGGISRQADAYRGMLGYQGKAGELAKEKAQIEANLLQREMAGLHIAAAKDAATERAERRNADAVMSNVDQGVDQVQQFRDTGGLQRLMQSEEVRNLSPEQQQAILARYNPMTHAREAGSVAKQGYGAAAGASLQTAMEGKIVDGVVNRTMAKLSNGDWKGALDYFSSNDYDNGRTYKLLGEGKDGVHIGIVKDGKQISERVVPKDLRAVEMMLRSSINPAMVKDYGKVIEEIGREKKQDARADEQLNLSRAAAGRAANADKRVQLGREAGLQELEDIHKAHNLPPLTDAEKSKWMNTGELPIRSAQLLKQGQERVSDQERALKLFQTTDDFGKTKLNQAEYKKFMVFRGSPEGKKYKTDWDAAQAYMSQSSTQNDTGGTKPPLGSYYQ